MRTVHVDAQSGSYDVLVGRGLLGNVGDIARKTAGGTRAFIVSNVNVSPLYGKEISASLEAAGYKVASKIVGSGESIKNMFELGALLESLAEAELTREDVVIALGGGVVGDLAGFAASIYLRGCNFIQVPTSLLAMVDSSVGGKTAVDLAHGKNLAGTFFQPKAVVADVSCLETISPDLFSDSCGEVIKYGVMCDTELFEELEREPLARDSFDADRIERIVARCISIKRDVVDADEREANLRQTLNLGHTIGHAIEASSGYTLGHGSCVAAGMCMIARACAAQGVCNPEAVGRIERVCLAHGLPIGADESPRHLFHQALSDKKRHGDTINVVLIRDIGDIFIQRTPLDDFKRLVELGCA